MNTAVAVRANVIVCSIQLHERLSLAKLAYQEEEEQRRKDIAANKEVCMYAFGFTRIFVLVAFLHVHTYIQYIYSTYSMFHLST